MHPSLSVQLALLIKTAFCEPQEAEEQDAQPSRVLTSPAAVSTFAFFPVVGGQPQQREPLKHEWGLPS